MSLMLFNQGVFIAMPEDNYGTDAIDAALQADDNVTYLSVNSGVSLEPVYEQFEPDRFRSSHDGVEHTQIASHSALEVTGPLKGPRSVGTAGGEAPNYRAFLRAANLKEAIVSATSATYSLQTANTDSLSAYLYVRNAEDGNFRLNHLTGGRGSMTFDFATNSEATWSSSIMGLGAAKYTDDLAYFDSDGQPAIDLSGTALTYAGTAALDLAPRMICQSMTLTLGATTYAASTASLDLAWTTTPREAMTASQTVSKLINTRGSGSRPNGNLAVADAAAYDDILSKWTESTSAALTIVLSDGTQKITFSMPSVQLGEPSASDNGGVRNWDIGYFVNGDWSSNPIDATSLTITYEEA